VKQLSQFHSHAVTSKIQTVHDRSQLTSAPNGRTSRHLTSTATVGSRYSSKLSQPLPDSSFLNSRLGCPDPIHDKSDVIFLPARRYASAVLAVDQLSVRLSVTSRRSSYHIKSHTKNVTYINETARKQWFKYWSEIS